LVALITYSPNDLGFNSNSTNENINNFIGVIGSYFSSLVITFIGISSYFIPLLFFILGLILIASEKSIKSYRELIILRTVSFIMILITTCVITSVHLSIPWMPEGAGGILGLAIASSLLNNFSIIGTTLLMLSIWFCFIPIFIGFSWITVIESIGRFIIKLTSLMIEASKKVLLKTKDISRKVEIKKSLKKNAKVKKENDKKTVLSTNLKTEATDKQYTTKPKIEKSKPIIEEGAKAREQRQSKLFESNESSSLPSLEILDEAPNEKYGNSEESLEALSRLLELKLKDFGIDATVEEVLPGPIVTRFEINPAPGVKVNQISNLSKDLARSLSVSSVRIVEVIEGKSYIGIEIPNEKRALVVLGEILRSKTFEDMNSPLTVALGKDIAGNPIVADLQKMPHLLIAGTTGSGKSVGINAMIISLLYKATPKDVRMILIDPKMLELSVYEGIPHLLAPVVTDMRQAANALRWCVVEMERRYRLMSELKVKNLKGFNKKIEDAIRNGEPIQDPLFDVDKQIQLGESTAIPDLETLPNIVVVIDELADMMLTVGKKVEQLITRLAAKARASGIHMIVATQRPSVDVITGLIKANIPSRIAFQVTAKVDSRTILDQMGAESLLGNGDMLYVAPGSSIPLRVHGAFVSDDEVNQVSKELQLESEPIFIEEITSGTADALPGIDHQSSDDDSENDPLFDEAVKLVTESRNASISSVQRKLRIGYNRSARIIEKMEEIGILSAVEPNGKREILAPPPPKD
jgi:S-DNA-T family DNA segregation ATPase FtsK/SpoIIIE